jgi:hypothetical protein
MRECGQQYGEQCGKRHQSSIGAERGIVNGAAETVTSFVFDRPESIGRTP